MTEKARPDPRMNGREEVLTQAQAEAAERGVSLEAVLLLTLIEAVAMLHAAQLATLELQKIAMRGPGLWKPRGSA